MRGNGGKWKDLASKMEEGDCTMLSASGDATNLCVAIRKSGFASAQRREGDKICVWKLNKFPPI